MVSRLAGAAAPGGSRDGTYAAVATMSSSVSLATTSLTTFPDPSFPRNLIRRPAIGSGPTGLRGRNRLPAIRVFGTSFVSTTLIHGLHFIDPKYSAAALTSSSVIALARSIIVLVFGFLGSAVCRR